MKHLAHSRGLRETEGNVLTAANRSEDGLSLGLKDHCIRGDIANQKSIKRPQKGILLGTKRCQLFECQVLPGRLTDNLGCGRRTIENPVVTAQRPFNDFMVLQDVLEICDD